MKPMDYLAVSEKAIAQIKKGAFLTVKAGAQTNTMTIGWATIGYLWRDPIFMVAVRSSRHTYGIIEKADDFTVSVPMVNMHREIEFFGTKSGRDQDKYAVCKLELLPAQQVVSPIIKLEGIHFECRMIYKNAMNPDNLIDDYKALYPQKDYHTLYFGKIVACYET